MVVGCGFPVVGEPPRNGSSPTTSEPTTHNQPAKLASMSDTLVFANYIDGRLCAPRHGRYLDVHEPAIGVAYAQCPDSDAADIDAAVGAAQGAFPSWAATPAAQRAQVLNRIADQIEARLEEFAAAESRDSGKPLSLARSLDIPRAVSNLRFFAAAVTQFSSEAHGMGEEAINYT